MPAASLTCAVSTLLPLLSVTLALQVLPLMVATPTWVTPSKTAIVVPASAPAIVPVTVRLGWLVAPPGLPIATTGAVVSSVITSAAVVELLPATSLNCAVIDFEPSAPRSPAVTVRLTLPAVMSAAVMVWRHRMRQRRSAQQQLHGVARRNGRIERNRKARRRHIGDAVGMRRAGVRCRRESRRAAGRRRGVEGDSQCRGGRAVAKGIAELRRNLLAAVGPEVARGHRQADAAGGDVRRGDNVASPDAPAPIRPAATAPCRRPPPSNPAPP